ncbi:polyprenyl synthetase family protein [Sporosarcina limicola]|uniref:Competence protein ComQ n=1 Tax=Sporosarcina limicola TaxID=34101 RepID=A0A927MI68_9BACL|nr:polyprenyl synthetase family protein [Sporosarcina limicola]MBE1555110.1 competence protein ComQ [Sporosarcina limicola]
MSIIRSNRIRNSLVSIISNKIEQPQLKAQLLEFVDYQSEKGFSFGEMLVLHYSIFKGIETEEIYTVAAAVEALILSFDILDDFEDDDCKDKPWLTESNLSLNATTALLFLSADIIRRTSFANKDKAISILLKYALRSISGQHKDLLNSCKNEADFIEMTLEKSGSLTTLACLVGACLATDDYPKEVASYAELIGLIGQINNDLVDIKKWNEKNDLLNKKYTLPIIYLLNCKDDELLFIHNYYDNKVDSNEVVQNRSLIAKKFVETGAIIYTEVIKRVYQNKALAEIQKLYMNPCISEQLNNYIN